MGVVLYRHNKIAYESACDMLSTVKRVAIVHPTGTGKSYIAFKMIEDNPDRQFCWLSPSEYIFQTQLENLNGETYENLQFFTYAKLMMMDDDELEKIQTDFIILDEFHRVGAQMWGKGVERLLEAHPQADILGLSATNIRYLDNRRDMVDELFDGNVASYMSLGEAIVRGILKTPKYVITMFKYQSEFDKYQDRINSAKNKAVKDKAQKYLDALKRTLEKSEGLEIVFKKHLTKLDGKYIAFCSNVEHMKTMIDRADEWFKGIDEEYRLYQVYSDSPYTSREFIKFKEDNSEHLKILFCIDQINEGIHVCDVSGVILFRPTISPIIYKQQIGRALTAGSEEEPVIIDVVNNIESISSIGTIQEEMQEAVTYLKGTSSESMIVNETFEVTDYVEDCEFLFRQLDEVLSASWELMYTYAKDYYKTYGNLEVPKHYKTPENYSLGSWINTQRRIRAGTMLGTISEERIKKLDDIGMRWGKKSDDSWQMYYQALLEYKKTYNNIDVSNDYVTEDNIKLGNWIANLRTSKSRGKRSEYLTEKHIKELDNLGMIWDKFDYKWEKNYLACAEYYMEHGDLNVPINYISEEGLRIGTWIRRMRDAYNNTNKADKINCTLTEEQISRLENIGMIWTKTLNQKWNYGYKQAVKYYNEHGNIDIPVTYIDDDGFALGKWLKRHIEVDSKTGKTLIKVTPDRKEKLDKLGMTWQVDDSWTVRINLCKDYYKQNGNLDISQDYVTDEGIWLGKWLYIMRKEYRKGQLNTSQVKQLNELGMDWLSSKERAWENQYQKAKILYETQGNINVSRSYVDEEGAKVGLWINRMKSYYKLGKLTSEQTLRLEQLEIRWT